MNDEIRIRFRLVIKAFFNSKTGWPSIRDWDNWMFHQIMIICVTATDELCTGMTVQWCDHFAVSRPTVTIRGPAHEVAAKSFAFFDGVSKYLGTLPYDMEVSAKFRSPDNSAFPWKDVGLPPVRTRL